MPVVETLSRLEEHQKSMREIARSVTLEDGAVSKDHLARLMQMAEDFAGRVFKMSSRGKLAKYAGEQTEALDAVFVNEIQGHGDVEELLNAVNTSINGALLTLGELRQSC